MRASILAVLLLLAPLALAAPPAAAQAGDHHVADEAGDAREDLLIREKAAACGRAETQPASIGCPAYWVSGRGLANQAAPPGVDLLGLRFGETPSALVVEIEVAELAADLSDVATSDERMAAQWGACWRTAESLEAFEEAQDEDDGAGCNEWVWAQAWRLNGALQIMTSYGRYGCVEERVCQWQVAFEHVGGSPGLLRWTVPRDLVASAEEGSVVVESYAYSLRAFVQRDDPRAFVQAYTPYAWSRVRVNDNWEHWFTDGTAWGEYEPFTFATPRAERVPVAASFVDPAGDFVADTTTFPMDILGAAVEETLSTVTLAVTVASVPETPDPAEWAWMALGLGETLVTGGYTVQEGVRQPYASACTDSDCDDWEAVPVNLSAEPGAPGRLRFTFDRADLDVASGDLMTLGLVEVGIAENPITGEPAWGADGPLASGILARVDYDFTGVLPPYRLGDAVAADPAGAPAVPVERFGIYADDPTADANVDALPLDALGALPGRNPAQYDITSIAAEPITPGQSRLSLGVVDLVRREVPPEAEAIVYAIGVQTDRGAFIVGYYQTHKRPGVPAKSHDYFCGADQTVFALDKVDPRLGDIVSIVGRINLGMAGNATRTNGTGNIEFYVPHSCFAQPEPGPVHVRELAAATYIVYSDSGFGAAGMALAPGDSGVVVVDDAHAPAGGVLEATVAEAVGPNVWLASPFGVDNFWDIFGIGAAVVTSGVGALLIARRRNLLKTYLAEIDHAVVAHSADARAREAALTGLRGRLKRDLARGAMSEGHYLIVERRLDEHLSRSRLETLSDAFPELPHRLLARLQSMLADGTMGEDDYRVFCAMVEDTELSPGAKEKIRRKAALWVRKDTEAA